MALYNEKTAKDRTDSYITTVDHKSEFGQEVIAKLRKAVKVMNFQSGLKKRIVLRGRLGKNNPNAAEYYSPAWRCGLQKGYIRLADAERVDVYILDQG